MTVSGADGVGVRAGGGGAGGGEGQCGQSSGTTRLTMCIFQKHPTRTL